MGRASFESDFDAQRRSFPLGLRFLLELRLLEGVHREAQDDRREREQYDRRLGRGDVRRVGTKGPYGNHVFQDRPEVMDDAQLRHMPGDRPDDRLPHEPEQQPDREGLPDDDGGEQEERAIRGPAPSPPPEYACVTMYESPRDGTSRTRPGT